MFYCQMHHLNVSVTYCSIFTQVFFILLINHGKRYKMFFSGTLTIPVSIVTELMGLARKLSLKNFEPLLVKNIVSIINMQNVSTILNMANLYSFEEVRDICHHFMDQNACEILETYGLSDLSQVTNIRMIFLKNLKLL